MAESGGTSAGGSYHPDMDEKAHETTYVSFTHFATVGAVFVVSCVVALAVGGVKHAWVSSLIMIILNIVTTAVGLSSPRLSWRPPAVVLGLLLLMMVFY